MMRAAAALELGALGEQSETERSETTAATESLRPLVARLRRGNANFKANSHLYSASSLRMARTEG